MLTGKSALITGSTSGIGRGVAIALASLGCKVMINGFGDQGDIDALLGELRAASGTDAIHHGADMTKPDEIGDMVQTCIDQLGGVDILVNNAGIQFVSPVDEFPVEKWDQIIAINLTSSFHTIRLVLPHMKQNKWGRIVNIASAHSLVASPFKSAYVAAKHGIAGLTKTVALEAAQHGITVNAVSPGYVLTPLVQAQIPDTAAARGITEEQVVNDVMLAAQPTKQFVEIDDVAQNVVHLCSDAAKGITGANLSIDGGWTAQ
ncbi:3-hydroxybutyrate dehydrogenase [Amylibacter ulvae]|uniref:3-hydroxybutyrate dehydrogenase n=1 Tax=Paramylibacter ulvae TaxID=1651968 RepID=A0ABQ3CVE0_9RHOB|nr:3-hydroxybutyrate dehydrogenase [Amylibacter ulvae]GHA45727.1 3-hydroxybutyrate dehydrogenase [Amylibacter ulvae]